MNQTRILVVDDSKLAAKMVADLLSAKGYQVATAYSADEALAKLRLKVIEPPHLIVSDVMMPGKSGYDLCRELRTDPATASIPIILLTARGGITEKVAGFEAGADDYLVKPVEPTELELRIKALLARVRTLQALTPPGGPPEARVIAVFSLRGGVGKSSLAVNLAVSLAQMWQTDVPLVDLSLESGHAALLLNLKPKYSWADLAKQPPEAIDMDMLAGYLVPHNSGVRVLAAPSQPELASLVGPTLVTTVLAMLKTRFRYVIIDLASSFTEVNLAALDSSDQIVLLFTPEIASLKVTTASLHVFNSLNYPPERLVPVLNSIFPLQGLPQKSVESALGLAVAAVIPYERTLFVEAINTGFPAILNNPNAPASIAMAKLAYQLSIPEMRDSQPERPSEMLTWVHNLMRR